MILDADMTVRPEDLLLFIDVFEYRNAEFVNGTRMVYPMQAGNEVHKGVREQDFLLFSPIFLTKMLQTHYVEQNVYLGKTTKE